jgi:hypothetical protein
MPERDPDELADQLEREADDMGRHVEQLDDEISDAREDWERKRNDPQVPGANPPPEQREGHADDAHEDDAREDG